PYCEPPKDCELITVDDTGAATAIPMAGSTERCFALTLTDLRQPVRAYVQAGGVQSAAFEIRLLDVPGLARTATMTVRPPAYLSADSARTQAIDEKLDVLQYGQLSIGLKLDRQPPKAMLRIKSTANASATLLPVHWDGQSANVATIAAEAGTHEAELVLDFDHGLK